MPAKELGDSTPNGVADAKDTHQEKAFKPPGALSDLSVAECIVAYVTLALIVGSFQIVLLVIVLLVGWGVWSASIAGPVTVMVLMFSTTLLPAHYSESFCRLPCWTVLHKYFNYRRYNVADPKVFPKPDKRYMLIEFPHGVFPVATILIATYFDEHYDHYKSMGRSIRGITASVLFYIPWVRHFMAWLGALPATKKNFIDAFESAGSCSVLPGGIAEMFLVNPHEERIYFKKRFGYIKVAVESGVDIVPVYHFGNSMTLNVLGRSDFIRYLSRKLKASLVLPYGKWGLPIPFRQQIVTVVGEAIPVVKCVNPSKELIRYYQRKIERSIRKLYYDHRHLVGWENRELSIE
ncbi:hypothetical protein AAMO2058_001658800 [Amorphochlora amoebiformis]